MFQVTNEGTEWANPHLIVVIFALLIWKRQVGWQFSIMISKTVTVGKNLS